MPISEQLGWQRMHPAAIVFGLVRIVRGNILPLLFGGLAAVNGNLFWLGAFVVFGMVIPAIAVLLHFFNFRFAVDGGHLVIHEGILSKRTRRIPFKRIHNLNSRESLLARLFKVVRLDVETAGGATAEASLTALSRETAQAIRDAVRAGKKDTEAADEDAEATEEPAAKTIYRIRMLDILVAGATTNRMGVIALGVGLLFQYATEWAPESAPDWISTITNWVSAQTSVSPLRLVLVVTVAVLLAFLLAWFLSIMTALVRYYGFTLSHVAGDLQIQTGLFTKREFSIPLEKIQALRCVTSAFRRPWRLLNIQVQTAGFMGAQAAGEESRQEQNVLVPITRHDHTDFFIRAVWPEAAWDEVRWHGVHPFTRMRLFRAMMFIAMLPLAATHLFLDWFSFSHPGTYVFLLILLTTAFGVAHLTYRQTAYAHENPFLFIKTGFLGLHFWVIPVSKIQNVAIEQDPFQRWRKLASLRVDVAGGGSREALIPNIAVDDAWLLFNRFANGSRLPDPKLAAPEAAPAS